MPSFAGRIVGAYLALCANPGSAIAAWGNIDGPAPVEDFTAAPFTPSDPSPVAAYLNLCRNPAQNLTDWLDLDGIAPRRASISTAAQPGADLTAWEPQHQPAPSPIADYLALCQNPASNWRAWLDLSPPANKGGLPHADMENAAGISADPLPELQIWMDAHERGRQLDNLPTRPPARAAAIELLQPVREARNLEADEAAPFRRKGLLQALELAALFMLRKAQDFATRRRRSRGNATATKPGQRGAAMSWGAIPPRGKQKGGGKHGPPRAPKRWTGRRHGGGRPKPPTP